ncbi:MAG: YbjN domain-containing protein [Muribaculaceae bacterium]|nr:YbjN domain-containing protein [Muribaculaceae bacterium]
MTLNDKVRRFFDRNEITYQFLPSEDENELDSFEAGFKGHNGNFKLRVLTNEEDEWMLIIGFPAFSVPQKYMEQRTHAANLLNRNRLFV